MKKFLMMFMLLPLLMLGGCYERVDAGNVGVMVHMLGSSKGVDHEVLGVGRYWVGWNDELYTFPTFQQQYQWTSSKNEGSQNDESFTFQTADQLSINSDIGCSYSVDPTKVGILFQTYRKGLDDLTHQTIHSMVRDYFNKFGAQDSLYKLVGVGKQDLVTKVQQAVQADLSKVGVIDFRLYILGKFRYPEQIEKSINDKIAATQKAQQAQNELLQSQAEAAKKVAEAEGEAKANEAKQKTITPLLIQWEALQVQRIAVGKWNGTLPSYWISSDKSVPIIGNIGTAK